MPNELLGWSAINEIGETRYWSDPETPPKCPECNAEMEPPAKCCGWYVREVYETDMVTEAAGAQETEKPNVPKLRRRVPAKKGNKKVLLRAVLPRTRKRRKPSRAKGRA